MRDERNAAARRLLVAIEGGAAKRPQDAPGPAPPGLLGVSLLDHELPLAWRLRLFLWFLARTLARLVLGRGREARA
jgi:hypothetical protein